MKTADLIPFILLELNECDKYGFELTKAIETKSNGNIVIKQPTLYTLLKKLEKSKFITSYWQDSEIGGKRHYYKLTENGRLQVSTLPSYDFLMKNALSEDVAEDFSTSIQEEKHEQEKHVSIMDALLNNSPAPAESILPTEDVFANENIDTSTELEINSANTEFLKESNLRIDEEFATNADVSKFTEKVVETAPQQTKTSINTNEITTKQQIVDVDSFSVPTNDMDIEYVDYVNFKNTENYKYSRKIASKMLIQSSLTSISLFIMILLCGVLSTYSGRSGLFYVFFIAAILIALFYPILVALNRDKIRLKYQSQTHNTKTKLRLYVGLTIMLTILVVCIVVNIKIGNNTIASILRFSNFENLYAPLLLTSVYFWDLLLKHSFLSKLNK